MDESLVACKPLTQADMIPSCEGGVESESTPHFLRGSPSVGSPCFESNSAWILAVAICALSSSTQFLVLASISPTTLMNSDGIF